MPNVSNRDAHRPDAAMELDWIISPSGATATCPVCGTMYDRHELVGYAPPFGDGCDWCNPEAEDADE